MRKTKNEIKSKNVNQDKKEIDELLLVPETDWYVFFNHIGDLINDYSQTSVLLNKDKRLIFFKFLKEAFATDAAKNLTDIEKDRLFVLTQQELTNYSYDLNQIDDLKMLYERFNVFLRVKHNNSNSEILDLIVNYANKIARSDIILDKQIKDIDWHFTNLFWILNVNFTHYVNNTIDHKDFEKIFDAIKNMNAEIRRWDPDSIFSFRTVLGSYRIARQNLEKNTKACEDLDKASKNFISNIIELSNHQCFSLTVNELKEAAYIEYVKNLSNDSKKLFSNLYKKVDKKQVFPNQYTYSYPDSRFQIKVLYQQLTQSEKDIINRAVLQTYSRVENLRTTLEKIPYKKSIQDQIFRLHIFKSKEEYVKYGPLWGINTAGGGYAQVRTPLEIDQYLINRPLLNDEEWYETFIYHQKGDTRNKPNKEGGNFRNLGHEVQHTLFYALMGPQGLHHLPSWMIEGAANALGNEKCFKEEADYIKNYQDRLPKIERIINMSYASGGDLYYFGSALFRFMLEKHSEFLKQVLNKAQEQKSNEEINLFIKNKLTSLETDFRDWLIKTIEICSSIDTFELQHTQIINEQKQYQLDLAENIKLKNFLKHNNPTKFVFHDTIFNLSPEYITRASSVVNAQNLFMEKPQTMVLQDYNWFKSALEIYVIENKLLKFKLTPDPDKITEGLVSNQGHEFSIRKIIKIADEKNVNLSPKQLSLLKPALEAFVLQSVDLSPNLKKRLDSLNQQQTDDPLKIILTKLISSDLVCENYLKIAYSRKDLHLQEMLSDAPAKPIKIEVTPMLDEKLQYAYQKQLKKNKALRKLLKDNGQVSFTFNDTTFVLTLTTLNRYDLSGRPQLILSGDFQWFDSALEIFFIRNFLHKIGLDASEETIAKLLNVSNEYVSNRQIKNIFPLENACFRSMTQEYVLNSDLSYELKNRLRQFGYDPIHHQAENPAMGINATTMLGALTLMVSNASFLPLHSILPTSHQLTQLDDDTCDENEVGTNNFYWYLAAGVLLSGAMLILGRSLWQRINVAKDNHSVKEQRKTSSPDAELEKLKRIKNELLNLDRKIQDKISRDAYAALFKKEVMIIRNNIEDLLNIVKKGFNPAAIFINGDNNYEQYNRLFIETLNRLNELKNFLDKFGKASLNKKANEIVASLRELRPLPTVPYHSADGKEVHVMIEEPNKRQNNKALRYTSQPVSTFRKISWLFNREPDNSPAPLAAELQVMVDDKNREEPTYANLRSM